MLLLQSLFLWINFAVCGYLLWHAPKHDERPGTKLRKLPAYFWFWQFVAALIVVMFKFSPWHLLWTAPISFLVAFFFDKLLFSEGYQPPSTSSLKAVHESKKYLAIEARDGYSGFLGSNPRFVAFAAQMEITSAQQLAMQLC